MKKYFVIQFIGISYAMLKKAIINDLGQYYTTKSVNGDILKHHINARMIFPVMINIKATYKS